MAAGAAVRGVCAVGEAWRRRVETRRAASAPARPASGYGSASSRADADDAVPARTAHPPARGPAAARSPSGRPGAERPP
ncbi:hypothetical protein CD790_20630 [Streptomyces sp. SAJ15]|nr:hypothetical protein CD790_20630 [Streptomyces sp. SAJ15]